MSASDTAIASVREATDAMRRWASEHAARADTVRRISDLVLSMAGLAAHDPEALAQIAWWANQANEVSGGALNAQAEAMRKLADDAEEAEILREQVDG